VYLDNADNWIKQSDPLWEAYTEQQSDDIIQRIKKNYNQLKQELLAAGAAQHIKVGDASHLLEHISNIRQIVRQSHKAARILYSLYKKTALNETLVEKPDVTEDTDQTVTPAPDKTMTET
jgi:hypothetical protein